jgi:hypothetical protein
VVDEGDQLKRCSKCKQIKSFSEFGKYKRGKHGLAYHCKTCRVPSQATTYAKKVASAGGRAKYNADAIMYRQLALQKDPVRARARKMFHHARERATRWDLEFGITFDDIVAVCGECCPVLCLELDWTTAVRKESSPTLDRLDNALGYVKGNILVMSWRANRLKSDGTADELQRIADFVRRRLALKQAA